MNLKTKNLIKIAFFATSSIFFYGCGFCCKKKCNSKSCQKNEKIEMPTEVFTKETLHQEPTTLPDIDEK